MSAHIRWPADRFFWTILDAGGWNRAGPLPAGLLAALENDLPEALGQVHVVGAPTGDGRVLVCAARRRDLEALDASVLSLAPESLPDLGARVEPVSLNLLVGAFEPRSVRRTRRLNRTLAAAAILASAGLTGFGLARRASHWTRQAEATRAALTQLIHSGLPSKDAGNLVAELARLRSATASDPQLKPTPNASLVLAAVLTGWPAQTSVRTQSILITPTTASITVAMEGDPTGFIRSLTPPPGWITDEPRITTADKVTRVFIQMHPSRPNAESPRVNP